MTSRGMRSGFWKMNFSEPCRYSLHITAALWVAVICRNIEAVTTRRSWKPFAQKARGFESLFLRHKNEHHPSWMVFIFILQSEGTNSRSRSETGSSHTAGTEHTTRNRLFAVSASRGDVWLNFILKRNGFYKPHPEQHTPLPSQLRLHGEYKSTTYTTFLYSFSANVLLLYLQNYNFVL